MNNNDSSMAAEAICLAANNMQEIFRGTCAGIENKILDVTLRDIFAAASLMALLPQSDKRMVNDLGWCGRAYQIADEMLKARIEVRPNEAWKDALIHPPHDTATVRLLTTYIDDSYVNREDNYIFFETDGHFREGKWVISPPAHICETYQEAEKKLKAMFWQYKSQHPNVPAPVPKEEV